MNPYATLEQLKLHLQIDDNADDVALERLLNGVTASINSYTRRVFWSVTATKYYTPDDPTALEIDDLLSITTLKTDPDADRSYGTTWTTDDYDLVPFNTFPKTQILVRPYGTLYFPVWRLSVEIAGSWGFSTTPPDDIVEATLVMANRLWKRRDTPLGIAGFPELGESRLIPGVDPDIVERLAPYVKWV